MICKVLYYNKHTHTLIIDYDGTRVQFSTTKYNGERYVDIEKAKNKFSISTGTAKKVSRLGNSNKRIKKDEDNIQLDQPIFPLEEADIVDPVD